MQNPRQNRWRMLAAVFLPEKEVPSPDSPQGVTTDKMCESYDQLTVHESLLNIAGIKQLHLVSKNMKVSTNCMQVVPAECQLLESHVELAFDQSC